MQYDSWTSIPSMFFDMAGQCAGRPFLWAKEDGTWRPRNWENVAEDVRRLAAGLVALGLQPGDRVVLASENRPEWAIADLAVMAAGGITVPAYTTYTRELHEHVMKDSGATMAFVSGEGLASTFLPAAAAADVACVIAMDPVTATGDVRVIPWADALADDTAEVESRIAAIERKQTSCLIYTSGTGGLPKGVILSHHALLSNLKSIWLGVRPMLSKLDTFLSFLPLSHAYEHTAGFFFPISIGAEIRYAEGVDTLITNMPEARPTIMTCVPRLYEVMRQRILAGVTRQGGMKKRLFEKAVELGSRRFRGESLGLFERLQDRVLDKLVRDKVRDRFGGRLTAMVSGGAALNPDVGTFFSALGLTLLQGYGQTEAAPVVSCNLPEHTKMASVGRPLPEVEVRIADDGEILVAGGLLMDGYWNNPQATSEVLRDGWLHTGDIGEFDDDGFLTITDRKKDIIVNSGGDNIAPQRVEGILNLEPEIAQCMVDGDRRPHLVALVVPDETWLAGFARERGLDADLASLAGHDALDAAVKEAVDRANANLSPIEKVRRIMVAPEPFTVENRLMTPTLKIRRHVVRERFGARLDALYG